MSVADRVSGIAPPEVGPGRIRPMERDDIPQLVALRRHAFARSERPGPDDLAAYFETIFFQSPFRDPDIQLLLYEDERARVGGIVTAARPLFAAADGLLARLPGLSREALPRGSIAPAVARGIVTQLEAVAGSRSLRPSYDEASLQWLLAQLVVKKRLRTPRQALVRDQAGDVAGWFVYYMNPGATSEVLQVAARPSAGKVVRRWLLWDSWRHGACLAAGRV